MRHEKNINDRYPFQQQPIYCFEIRNAALKRTEYRRYLITDTGSGPTRKRNWRIRTDTRTIYRTEAQMDRVTNNRFYTFNPDPERAIKAFTLHLKTRKAACMAEIGRIAAATNDLNQAIATYESEKESENPSCRN